MAYIFAHTAWRFVNNDITDSLHYSLQDDMRQDFAMYIRDTTDHELVTILNKCISRMPEDALREIITEYTSYYALRDLTFLQYVQANPLQVMVAAMGLVILLLLLWQWWRGRLFSAVKQSNLELERQLGVVGALSRDYLNIYVVNIRENTVRIVKLDGYVLPGLERDSGQAFSYQSLLDRYIRERVYPQDQEKLADALALETVVRRLETSPEYMGSYRVLVEGEVHTFQFTCVRVGGEASAEEFAVLAGFRNIDDIVREEREQKAILANALEAARQASHAKTVFLNSMSHDMRTPMNAIIGFTTLASSRAAGGEQIQNYLDKIMTSSRHLLSLINDVLDMSRIESGKVSLEEQEASLPEILHDLRTIAQANIMAKQLRFSVDALDVRNETVICDRLRLSQVLLNLLSNAVNYTPPGGSISVRLIQEPDAPKGRGLYRFLIRDTGIGMGKEFMEHMFEPFEREQTATVSGIQGSGLGLAITRNIISMMKGTVEVESEVGKGTTFTVTFSFPVAEPPARRERVDSRALILGGDREVCESLGNMFADAGLSSDRAGRGQEALELAHSALERGEPYGLYLIDDLAEDWAPLEVVRGIRQMAGESARIFILTAYDWTDLEAEAREAGVTAFCEKPLFYSEICKILDHPFEEPGKAQPDAAEQSEATDDFTGKKLLLVEDNELNQEIARELLEEVGFAVEVAGNGQEAVERMKGPAGADYDIILMDIQMPVMDGYTAAREIRALEDPGRAAVPIVALSANAFAEDREKSREAGMDSHVAKPLAVGELMGTLRELLS